MINNVKKNYIWNTLGTACVSFLSLILMILVTRINGMEMAGIFSFSFSSACIINIFALYCGRTYQVTDDNKQISESSYVVTRLLTAIGGIVISILFTLINGYSMDKSIIFVSLCSLKCLEAICDVYYGINQKHRTNQQYCQYNPTNNFSCFHCITLLYNFKFFSSQAGSYQSSFLL